jgi:putative methionine-R-sulfoxide reductase with GAF domain
MPSDKTFERLHDVATSAANRNVKAREVAECIRAARNYRWVGIYDVTPMEIVAIAWTGENAPTFLRFPLNQGLNGAAVASRQNVIVQDVTKDSRYLTTFGSTHAEAIFVVASPANGRIVGTIDVESERTNAFSSDDEKFLSRCAEALKPLWLESAVKN